MVLLLHVHGALAATLTVCSTADTGAGGCDHTTLSSAHTAAATGDTLLIYDTLDVTGEVSLTKAVTIQGAPGAVLATVGTGSISFASTDLTVRDIDLALG
ncbi:MAG: hypothetical protein KC656_28430, partial [Myxococcales bacterium]|nr:hypothetical protein [Myxococcales bacterium]